MTGGTGRAGRLVPWRRSERSPEFRRQGEQSMSKTDSELDTIAAADHIEALSVVR
jgi:hypothetical protein